MFNYKLSYKQTKRVVAIEKVEREDAWFYNVVVCSIVQDDIEITSSKELISDIKDIENYFKEFDLKSLPCVLVISSRQILVKAIPVNSQYNDSDSLLQTYFPQIDKNQFKCQIQAGNDLLFLSVLRKTNFEETIGTLEGLKIHVTHYFLGGYFIVKYVNKIRSQLPDRNILNLGCYRINKVNSEINFNENSDNEVISFGDLTVSSTLIVPFLSGIEVSFNEKALNTEDSAAIILNNENLVYRNKFIKAFNLILICSVLSLLLSFLIFNEYFASNKKLESYINISSNAMIRKDSLYSAYTQTKLLFDSIGITNNISPVFCADRIASTLPDPIALKQMWVYPVIKLKEGTKRRFDSKKIEIEGATSEISKLNDWVNKLKSYQWIKQAELIKLNREENTGVSNFEISIIIR